LSTDAEKLAAKAELLKLLERHDTIYFVVRHRNDHGEWESVTLHIISEGKLKDITLLVSKALRVSIDRYHGIRSYWTDPSPVFQLSTTLFRDGTALAQEQI
jgi:hypothetical protein